MPARAPLDGAPAEAGSFHEEAVLAAAGDRAQASEPASLVDPAVDPPVGAAPVAPIDLRLGPPPSVREPGATRASERPGPDRAERHDDRVRPEPALQAEALERTGCTAAQLRRFIKSRAYVPLHELRRRFELNGDDDDVSPLDLAGQRLFVGLPEREASLLGELLRAGDVGCELMLDPTCPLVIGVYPMRPVPRA